MKKNRLALTVTVSHNGLSRLIGFELKNIYFVYLCRKIQALCEHNYTMTSDYPLCQNPNRRDPSSAFNSECGESEIEDFVQEQGLTDGMATFSLLFHDQF
jgi:hypothetical protein